MCPLIPSYGWRECDRSFCSFLSFSHSPRTHDWTANTYGIMINHHVVESSDKCTSCYLAVDTEQNLKKDIHVVEGCNLTTLPPRRSWGCTRHNASGTWRYIDIDHPCQRYGGGPKGKVEMWLMMTFGSPDLATRILSSIHGSVGPHPSSFYDPRRCIPELAINPMIWDHLALETLLSKHIQPFHIG